MTTTTFTKKDYATVRYTANPGQEYQAVIERDFNALPEGEEGVLVRGRESNALGVARAAAIALAEKYGVPYQEPNF